MTLVLENLEGITTNGDEISDAFSEEKVSGNDPIACVIEWCPVGNL